MENKFITKTFKIAYSLVRKTNDHEDEALAVIPLMSFWYTTAFCHVLIPLISNFFTLSRIILIPLVLVAFIVALVTVYKFFFNNKKYEIVISEYLLLNKDTINIYKLLAVSITIFLILIIIPMALYVW